MASETLDGMKKAHSGKVWTTGELPSFDAEEDGQALPGKGPLWSSRALQPIGKLQLGEDAAAMEPLPFRRASSTPAAASNCSPACRTVSSGLFDQELEEDSECDFPEVPRRRAVTEPARPKRRPSFLQALFAVDSALPFSGKVLFAVDLVLQSAREAVGIVPPPPPVVNLLLCVVSLAAGCIFPVLVDLSKTATAFGPDGAQVSQLPYRTASVLQTEAAFNVGLGILAIAVGYSKGGFSPLLRTDLHLQMLPLTLVYCLGDIAALCAIERGGGPLYIAITNSRLLVAAGVSHCVLGRRQNRRQWLLLAEISLATVAFAVFDAGSKNREKGGDSSFGRAAVGISWALVKAFLSGLAAVLTECRYKKIDLWHANTLLKGQSLLVALLGGMLHWQLGPDEVPLCGTAEAVNSPWCVDRRGWDLKTWAVLTCEIGTGWLSVAVLTRMSAIAKFVCKTAAAPSLYLFYSVTGVNGFRFDGASFVAVSLLATGILAYTAEPYLAYLQRDAQKLWAGHYPRFQQRPARHPR